MIKDNASVGGKDIRMDEKAKEFSTACKPMIEFLRKYYDPMSKAIISDGFSEVVIGDMGYTNEVQD